jgi:hypothetical protein
MCATNLDDQYKPLCPSRPKSEQEYGALYGAPYGLFCLLMIKRIRGDPAGVLFIEPASINASQSLEPEKRRQIAAPTFAATLAKCPSRFILTNISDILGNVKY